jgi:protein-S-isoprenylcysteine O-methyltransferase Ste14
VPALPRNPEVIAARSRRHTGTRTFDTVLMSIYRVVYLGLFVVAGLDAKRFGWAPLTWPWALAGAVLLVAGTVPIAGAMGVNRNLETSVRIQIDRGHQVVITGPYRYVRHPMYVGQIVQLPAAALLLGSTWALLPALACVVIMVIRTALEDRMLRDELAGYRAYSETTRFRLVPGVW